MLEEPDLCRFLPSRQTQLLGQAIGRTIIEIARLPGLTLDRFLLMGQFDAKDYFGHNPGPVQIDFSGGLSLHMDVWGEQLSIIVMPGPIETDIEQPLSLLSRATQVSAELHSCLGQTCQDVRIWTLRETVETGEAGQTSVSYLFESGTELFYVIYLHEDLDADYLMVGTEVSRDRVDRCYSLATAEYIDV